MKAQIITDRDFVLADLDRRIFGTFVEHMGRCVYGGIYEPEHPTADENGFRGDVLELTRELGATTVRFNFRGTGNSAGTYDGGDGEVEDLGAVAAWVRASRPRDQLWLAGFSFGAYVSLRAASALQPSVLVSIAPPAGRWDFSKVVAPTMLWLVIQGEADEIVDPEAVYAWLADCKADAELVRMPDTSHFFHRKLIDLRGAIKNGVRSYLPDADA